MADQINREHQRVLDCYAGALKSIISRVQTELLDLERAPQDGGTRFNLCHGILDAAKVILDTDVKMQVFNNLCWTNK